LSFLKYAGVQTVQSLIHLCINNLLLHDLINSYWLRTPKGTASNVNCYV